MAFFYVDLHPMKEKLLIIFFAWMIGLTVALSQARIIMPDSSQITTNPDSLDLLPRQSSSLDHRYTTMARSRLTAKDGADDHLEN